MSKPESTGANDALSIGLAALTGLLYAGLLVYLGGWFMNPAEAAVGLALIIAIYRHYRSANVDDVNSLKG